MITHGQMYNLFTPLLLVGGGGGAESVTNRLVFLLTLTIEKSLETCKWT